MDVVSGEKALDIAIIAKDCTMDAFHASDLMTRKWMLRTDTGKSGGEVWFVVKIVNFVLDLEVQAWH